MSTVEQSYDRIAQGQKGRSRDESTETPFRAFNNFVKRTMIMRFLDELCRRGGGKGGVVAMDLGAGRGGDLPKWIFLQSPTKAEASNAVFVTELSHFDVSAVSVEEAARRYEALCPQCRHEPPKAKFVVADVLGNPTGFWGETVGAEGIPQGSVDVVSMQFCLHYGCATEELLKATLTGISGVLKTGGWVLLTIVDSDELVARLQSAREKHTVLEKAEDPSDKTTQNGVITWTGEGPTRISFGSEWKSVLTPSDCTVGLPYHFSLSSYVDATEYSLPLHALVRVARDVGLSLVTSVPFGGGLLGEFLAIPRVLAQLKLSSGSQFPKGDLEVVTLYRTVILAKKA